MADLPDDVRERARAAVAPAVDRWLGDDADHREFASVVGADAAAEIAYAAGGSDERANTVAWLRGCAERMRTIMPKKLDAGSPFELAADAIEQGKHRG